MLSDIGNEPDDQMSLVRLLVYSNEIDIEGFGATTSVWQKDKVRPDIAREVIAAYGAVRPNLQRHAAGWPTAEALSARVSEGLTGYGLGAFERASPAAPSAAARALVAAADRSDPRPLWIALWGGANTLAEALRLAETTKSAGQFAAFVGKLRVYSISDQDDAGPWIRRRYPALFMIVTPSTPDGSDYARATWTGISGDRFYRNGAGADFSTVSNEWLDANIRSKGPLGAHYPRYMFIMEGDTPSFLGLIPNGLQPGEHPEWGGWGGRYLLRQPYGEARPVWTQGGDSFPRVTSADTVGGTTSDQATIWRWREAFQNDFAARMDWTIKPAAEANHAPVVVVDGTGGTAPLRIAARVGEPVQIDASRSRDPDGNALSFRWIAYPEAGFTGGYFAPPSLTVEGDGTPRVRVSAAATCTPNWLAMGDCPASAEAHLVLAVTDNGKPALTRYRRIIVTVSGPAKR
ncbi:DUF1593 domain-containing protein [Novosphingobium sp. KCTC 2891]|uniref:nucleoside hydrolase-like domain-containing protein n=1 Tax=Novosphingobium sp. KCTC 2891 TaxID=2989730 RepID=UPI002223AC41|nr:nucleoside hydrolase-like domain-containing protein [Novosphingobium sp. KCTC 2891]MCW1382420.1 DUF1593 domain-containing protein [Novosphingobium sp. KCTC 2891]